jgi:hypothetical protein
VNRDLDLSPVGEHIGISRYDNTFARERFSRIEPVEIIRSEIGKDIVVGGAPAQQHGRDNDRERVSPLLANIDVPSVEIGGKFHVGLLISKS